MIFHLLFSFSKESQDLFSTRNWEMIGRVPGGGFLPKVFSLDEGKGLALL